MRTGGPVQARFVRASVAGAFPFGLQPTSKSDAVTLQQGSCPHMPTSWVFQRTCSQLVCQWLFVVVSAQLYGSCGKVQSDSLPPPPLLSNGYPERAQLNVCVVSDVSHQCVQLNDVCINARCSTERLCSAFRCESAMQPHLAKATWMAGSSGSMKKDRLYRGWVVSFVFGSLGGRLLQQSTLRRCKLVVLGCVVSPPWSPSVSIDMFVLLCKALQGDGVFQGAINRAQIQHGIAASVGHQMQHSSDAVVLGDALCATKACLVDISRARLVLLVGGNSLPQLLLAPPRFLHPPCLPWGAEWG